MAASLADGQSGTTMMIVDNIWAYPAAAGDADQSNGGLGLRIESVVGSSHHVSAAAAADSDWASLLCHESSPIDEEVVYTSTSAAAGSSVSASGGGVSQDSEDNCNAFIPIEVALAGLESSPAEASCEARRSFADPKMLTDRRVLKAMLSMDDQCLPSAHYFRYTQPDLQPYMRRMVVSWMLEVCEEQQCEEEVFPLAVNYLDRVLSVLAVKRTQLQLLGCTCMFIASKFKDTSPLAARSLVIYTDHSITMDELLEWEMQVLDTLKWEVSAVTPHDFIEYIVSRLPLSVDERNSVRRHAKTFIALCTSDFKFVICPPSMVAAACVSCAATGLFGESRCRDLNLIDHLRDVTSIDQECLRHCQEQIEESLRSSMSGSQASTSDTSSTSAAQSSSSSSSGTVDVKSSSSDSAQSNTPTDVRDINLVSVN